MKEVFKLTKSRVIVILFLFLIWLLFFGVNKSCNLMARLCSVDADTPGARPSTTFEGKYEVSAKSLPFLLSCKQTCGEEEYNSELKKVWTNFIIFKTIIPLIVIYVVFCLLNSLVGRLRKK